MGLQAHFICPCPTLSKWVTGKSCRSLLPPSDSNPPTNPSQAHLSTLKVSISCTVHWRAAACWCSWLTSVNDDNCRSDHALQLSTSLSTNHIFVYAKSETVKSNGKIHLYVLMKSVTLGKIPTNIIMK